MKSEKLCAWKPQIAHDLKQSVERPSHTICLFGFSYRQLTQVSYM